MDALPESGQTEVTGAVARLFVALCAAIVVGVPLVQHLGFGDGGAFGAFFSHFGEIVRSSDAEVGVWRRANRRLEARMDALESRLEERSWLLETALGAVQHPLLLWGGVGNENVYVGYRGWLFWRPGVDYVTGPGFLEPSVLERRRRSGPSWETQPSPDPRPAILDFHRQLAERGIRLIVMPVPTKVTLVPEALAPRHAASDGAVLQNPSFSQLVAELESAGVIVFDPTPALAQLPAATPPFLMTDSHWSPEGVDAVARELARRVRDLHPSAEEAHWRRKRLTHANVGDLATALRLPEWAPVYRPEKVTLESVTDAQGNFWQNDPQAEVLLLGDSFSNVFSQKDLHWGRYSGLAEQLSFHLRRGVWRAAVNNAGAKSSREKLARLVAEGEVDLENVEVVVWELAVRELAIGDWRKVALGADPPPPRVSP